MRVLFLTNQLEMGGIERNVVRLTGGLVEHGHEVLAATRGGILVDELIRAGGTHVELEVRPRALAIYRDVRRLRQICREFDPDIVHVFSASTALLSWLLRRSGITAWFRKRPVFVSSIMGLQTDPAEGSIKVLARAFSTVLGADRVLVMAPAIGNVVRKLPVRRGRLIEMWVVGVESPLPIDERAKDVLRDSIGVARGAPLVMTIGRLDPSKSHELFLQAAALVAERSKEVRFVVVGGGPLRQELEEEIARLGVNGAVLLLGERMDAAELLAIADVYVRPGTVEGFVGITVLEAQMRGVPVVAFETEDVKLAIRNGESGVLVANGDPDALAEAVWEILSDPTKAAALAANGARSVKTRFSLDHVITDLEALYGSLTTGLRTTTPQ